MPNIAYFIYIGRSNAGLRFSGSPKRHYLKYNTTYKEGGKSVSPLIPNFRKIMIGLDVDLLITSMLNSKMST